MKLLFKLILFTTAINFIFANETQDTVNYKNIIIEAGVAFGHNLSNELPIEGIEYDNNSISLFMRILLQSENILKIGIESGLLPIKNIYNLPMTNQFGTTQVKANLDAVPILLLFSMDISKFSIYYGMGYYYIISRISAFDEISTSTDYSLGLMFSLEYNFELNEYLKLGAFAKLNLISDSARTLMNLGIKLEYHFLKFK